MSLWMDLHGCLFGDNKSVITSSTLPHSTLTKCHNALSYHCVREAIASNVMFFIHIDGIQNPLDALSKHLGHAKMWQLIQPLLFWKGETDIDAKQKARVLALIEGSDRMEAISYQNSYLYSTGLSNHATFGDGSHYSRMNIDLAVGRISLPSNIDIHEAFGDLNTFPDRTPHLFVDSQDCLSDLNM